jgi:hypothetical protein
VADTCDMGRETYDRFVADCIARRTGGGIQPGAGGTCAICGELIPANRLATGAGTCIDCQIRIERGELA